MRGKVVYRRGVEGRGNERTALEGKVEVEERGRWMRRGSNEIYNRNYDAPLRHVLSLSQTRSLTHRPRCDTIAIRTASWPSWPSHRYLLPPV